MAKTKVKNIDNLSEELKNKFNNVNEADYKIGVVVFTDEVDNNSYSLFLGNVVKEQIIKNGFEAEVVILPSLNERFRTFGSDNYVLSAYKKQVSNMLELVLFDKKIDGVVYIANGFNSTLAGLISSIRLNLPTMVLPIGLSPKSSGTNLLDALSLPGLIAINEKSVFDYNNNIFEEIVGSGNTLNNENLFNVCLEIMELCLKNSSLTTALSYEKLSEAKEAGNKIVLLTKNRLPLKKMINKKSIDNITKLNYCLGGNPSIILAIKDLCNELDLDYDLNKIFNNAKNFPVLYNTYSGVNLLKKYGGVWALIKAMIKEKLIDGNYKTFSDKTLTEETKEFKDTTSFVRLKPESLYVLRGNLADRYSVAKTVNMPEENLKFYGSCLVFENDQDACNAVLNKVVEKDNVIVINNCGEKTSAGLSTISQTAIALKSMNLKNIVITDGLISEDVDVCGISLVCPDSKDGTIKVVKDGDKIEIDFVKGKLNLEVGSKEITLRTKKYVNSHKILPKYLEK